MDIKPIETKYKGYKFRSRLEARWAVFFDAVGMPYEYEREGFDVNGRWYLPDFYLPWYRCYVEIKPDVEEDIKTADEILKPFSESKSILLCIGDPLNDNMALYEKGKTYSARFLEGCWWGTSTQPESAWCGTSKHWISLICDTTGITTFKCAAVGTVDFEMSDVDTIEVTYLCYYRDDLSAYKKKAREARFEHGEKPE